MESQRSHDSLDMPCRRTDSLRLALTYRDRLSQAIIDRGLAATVTAVTGGLAADAASTAFPLLNEGWGWQTRKPAGTP